MFLRPANKSLAIPGLYSILRILNKLVENVTLHTIFNKTKNLLFLIGYETGFWSEFRKTMGILFCIFPSPFSEGNPIKVICLQKVQNLYYIIWQYFTSFSI